ncbi:LysR substrate-binding domain-containing protein [Kribbella sp. NPDC050820]|uniref:LysR substrate-binding domain-containing protein n=1 Tax=Kribbella sp. NPDC050820 TaxID=3155408 RepID=UPI0033C41A32
MTPVPRILWDFRQQYPRVDLELTVSQSEVLQRRVESGHLDVAFVKQAPGQQGGRLVRRDRLVWAGVAGAQLGRDRPVPLIVYQAPSITRSLGVQVLAQAGLPYRVRCTVRSVLGATAAARAGPGPRDLRAQPGTRRPHRTPRRHRPARPRRHRPRSAHPAA